MKTLKFLITSIVLVLSSYAAWAATATWIVQPGIYFKYNVPVKVPAGDPPKFRVEHALSTDLETVKENWIRLPGTYTQFKSTAIRPATKYDPIVVVTPVPAPPTCATYVCTTENGEFIINVADSVVQKCPAFRVTATGQIQTWDAVQSIWDPVTQTTSAGVCPKGTYTK